MCVITLHLLQRSPPAQQAAKKTRPSVTGVTTALAHLAVTACKGGPQDGESKVAFHSALTPAIPRSGV
jgi:hypothetical protein